MLRQLDLLQGEWLLLEEQLSWDRLTDSHAEVSGGEVCSHQCGMASRSDSSSLDDLS